MSGPEAVIFVDGLKVARTLAKDSLTVQFELLTVGSRIMLGFHSRACVILYQCDMSFSNLQHPSFKHFPDSVGGPFNSVDEDVDGFLADALDRLLDV